MIDRSEFGLIRINKTPSGGAPFEVREKWVGVEIPCLWRQENNNTSRVIGTDERAEPRAIYAVLQREAIQALAAKDRAAAQWWNEQGFPKDDPGLLVLGIFTFGVDEAEEVKPVKRYEDVSRDNPLR